MVDPPVDPLAPEAPPVAPVANTGDLDLNSQKWTEWETRWIAAKDNTKDAITKGKENIRRIRHEDPKSSDVVLSTDDSTFVSQKIAQLFYRVPGITLEGKTPDDEPAAPLFQEVINEELDAEHTNVKQTIDECLTDVVAATGFAAAIVRYEAVTEPQIGPDGQPVIGPDGKPMIALVHEQYCIDRIPPGRLRWAPEFHGSDFDRAAWNGFLKLEDCPPGTPGASTSREGDEEDLLSPVNGSVNYTRSYLKVRCVWFQAHLFDETVVDPTVIHEFEWVEGQPRPRLYRKCPYKKFPGFPVKVLTLKYISDAAIPPADCTVTRNMIDIQSVGLSQELRHRDRTLPQNIYNSLTTDKEFLDKLDRGTQDAWIGYPGDPRTAFAPIPKGPLPQDHYAFREAIDRKIAASWSMGNAQTGAREEGTHTATEINTVEASHDVRLDYDRDKVVVWFLTKLVRPLAALIQQYKTEPGYVKILGIAAAQRLAALGYPEQAQAVNPAAMVSMPYTGADIQGEFKFKIKINSQLRPDSTADIAKAKDIINFGAKSPYMNQMAMWRYFAEANGLDPGEFVVQPPPPKPEPVIPALKGEDLDPLMNPLKYANVFAILQLSGVTLPITPDMAKIAALTMMAQASQAAQPGQPNPLTPGAAPEADTVNKHKADETGLLPGAGATVALQTGAKVM